MSLLNDVLRDLDRQTDNSPDKRLPPGLMAGTKASGNHSNRNQRILIVVMLLSLVAAGVMLFQLYTKSNSFQSLSGIWLAFNEEAQVSESTPMLASEIKPAPLAKAIVNSAVHQSTNESDIGAMEQSAPVEDKSNQSTDVSKKSSVVSLTSIPTSDTRTSDAKAAEALNVSSQQAASQTTKTSSPDHSKNGSSSNLNPDKPKVISSKPERKAAKLSPVPSQTGPSGAATRKSEVVSIVVEPVETISSKPAETYSEAHDTGSNEKKTLVSKSDKPKGSSFEIQPSLSPKAVAERELNKARELYRNGYSMQAENILQSSLKDLPEHDSTRHQLASWMVARANHKEALILLNNVDVSSSTKLRLIKAHALVVSSAPDQALALLKEPLPPLMENTAFYSLRAGLLQQTRQYDDALLVYAELVEIDPRRGEWWAGLGVSLDQTGRLSSAVRAYKQALNDPGLSRQLARYAEMRIQRIGSQQSKVKTKQSKSG